MAKISRRGFLRTAAGASAGLLAAHNGIAFAQDPTPAPLPQGAAGKLTVIHKTEYFAAVQDLFREDVVKFAADKGVELDISTANPEIFGDFLAKMLAAVEAGNPPDLGYHVLSIPQMYSLDIVEDVTDVVDQAISLYGNVVPPIAEANGKIDGKWWGVPFMSVTGAWFARKDLFEAKGIDVNTLDTWDARRDAALAVSDPDNNVWGWGLSINRSGDAHGLILGVIQGFGGSFTDETGLKVVFNSPETVAAVEWLAEIYTSDKYKPMLPPGVESWTDTSNNEAYLAGTIALTTNQPSVYGKAKADGNPVFENTAVLHAPKTLDGRLLEAGNSGWFTIFKGAKNKDLSKELILHMLDPMNLTPMAQVGGGLFLPAYESLWTDDVLGTDPNFTVFRDILLNPDPFYGRSHPAKPNALIDAIDGAGITSQMMANATSGGMSAADAVKDAHDKIVQIFEEGGVPQS
ncbi:MAG: extracellular solute-binding protein [Chloroflexi bacterium]|nr:extracellular solute-binding protein [Chloroflexota bacterium]MCC6891621.1 extracellular solute-binding protein [Anaerolineae bacterium]